MGRASSNMLRSALLGLLAQGPRSGYDLRKQFAETPMQVFSDSPGSIYPALQRLRREGLIVEASPRRRSGRRRQDFKLTPAGLRELEAWLRRPITRQDVIRSLDELMLRFAFTGEVLGVARTREFLRELHAQLSAYVAELESFHEAAAPHMSLSGRLALQSGIDGFRLHARWAKEALGELQRAQT